MAARLDSLRKPTVALALVVLLSLAARVAWLGAPCHAPCRTGHDHALVFDETYYVPAARVIAGLPPVAGQHYASTPSGDDPNAEHPQLVKLAMAGAMRLLGDGPAGWRFTGLLAGVVAILGMFALVRALGGGPWPAVGVAALMAADNLMIVHGRIGTLDMPVVAAMIWALVLYLRGHALGAGALVGLGTCMKLVAPYALLVAALWEWLRPRPPGEAGSLRRGLRPLAAMTVAAGVVMLGLLQVLGLVAPPYDPSTGHVVGGGAIGHLAHMLSFGSSQTSPHGPRGIASWPWGWLVDFKPIVYLNVDPAHPAPGLTGLHPPVHFLGVISPPVLLFGVPCLGWLAWRRRARHDGRDAAVHRLGALALAWFGGTFLPFLVLSVAARRTSYLYYMVVVMPGLYIAAALAAQRLRQHHPRVVTAWMAALVMAAAVMYPLTPLP